MNATQSELIRMLKDAEVGVSSSISKRDAILARIGEQMRAHRKRLKLPLRAMSKKLKVSYVHLHHVETGKRRPTLKMITTVFNS